MLRVAARLVSRTFAIQSPGFFRATASKAITPSVAPAVQSESSLKSAKSFFDKRQLKLEIGDFPEEPMYKVTDKKGEVITEFDDLPSNMEDVLIKPK